MVAEGDRSGAEREQSRPEVSVAAIVLAAGRATRMGGQKLLLPLGGRPLVQWAVDAALGSKASEHDRRRRPRGASGSPRSSRAGR